MDVDAPASTPDGDQLSDTIAALLTKQHPSAPVTNIRIGARLIAQLARESTGQAERADLEATSQTVDKVAAKVLKNYGYHLGDALFNFPFADVNSQLAKEAIDVARISGQNP
jgi:S-adenosylmethionine synthetase